MICNNLVYKGWCKESTVVAFKEEYEVKNVYSIYVFIISSKKPQDFQ